MIRILQETEGELLATRAVGKLTEQDYNILIPILEEKVKKYGEIKWYFEMDDFEGWEGKALWSDLKFDIRHRNDFEKIAMVGEDRWEKLMTDAMKPFTKADIKYFDVADRERAKEWIKG